MLQNVGQRLRKAKSTSYSIFSGRSIKGIYNNQIA
jgi:hypothetical protein